MQIIKIPKKKKGEFRTIYMPSDEEKQAIRRHLPTLNSKAKNVCGANVHGFMCGKSPVTNAKAHIGFRFTLNFDLKDFFDTVKVEHLRGKLSTEQMVDCLVDGAPRQGLPTSPVVANIAAIDLDKAIKKFLSNVNEEVVYTRYADDLSFSFRFHWTYEKLLKGIPAIVQRCGFKLNERKTRLQDGNFGLRNITGVNVGYVGIQTPRSVKRRLRAAQHRGNHSQAHGLKEWMKLKEPTPIQEKVKRVKPSKSVHAERVEEYNLVAKHFGKKRCKPDGIPVKDDIRLRGDVVISGEPARLIAPSDWQTNWTSCLQYPKPNSKGNHFWVQHPSIRMAILEGKEMVTINTVSKPRIKARALTYDLEGGVTVYGRLFGESGEATTELKNVLESNGYRPCHEFKGKTLRHLTLSRGQPYFDNIAVKHEAFRKVLFAIK